MPRPGQEMSPLAKARITATTRRTRVVRLSGRLDAALKELIEADARVQELEADSE